MLRKIEYLIPAALSAINDILVAHYMPAADKQGKEMTRDKKKGIPSGYQSAISGFGTDLLQMGLLPTLAVYLDDDSDADIDRKKLLAVLVQILRDDASRFSAKENLGMKENTLLDALQPGFPKDEFKEHLLKASVAFKLAIRTYKLEKK